MIQRTLWSSFLIPYINRQSITDAHVAQHFSETGSWMDFEELLSAGLVSRAVLDDIGVRTQSILPERFN